MKVLIDTTCWIEYIRPQGQKKVQETFSYFVTQETPIILDVIFGEIFAGNLSKKNERIVNNLEQYFYKPIVKKEDWIEAGKLLQRLRKKGKTIPLVDALIAHIALRDDYHIFTLDKHFQYIPKLKLL